jgi:hypothetical protein
MSVNTLDNLKTVLWIRIDGILNIARAGKTPPPSLLSQRIKAVNVERRATRGSAHIISEPGQTISTQNSFILTPQKRQTS